MNKKGFTLIELITTFALTAVIVILLVNIIVVIKNIYTKTDLRTELYIGQGNLSNSLNKKISKDKLVSYSECNDTDFCYIFDIYAEDSVKLTISDNVIKFGSFTYKVNQNAYIDNPSVTREYISGISDANDSFLIIKIPIKARIYPDEDYGINLVYPYNSNITFLGV